MSAENPLYRYNLQLPEKLFKSIEELAKSEGVKVVDVIRQFVKLGLVAVEAQKNPDEALLYKRGNKVEELRFLF